MNSGLSRKWGDWMIQEDEDRSQCFVRMTDEQWRNCKKAAVTNNRGKGDLRPVLNWIEAVEDKRATKVLSKPLARDPASVTFRAWKDMVLEPFKYSDSDWADWLAWDEELTKGPGRWRIAAFWHELDKAETARIQADCATRIQAAWRGHVVRDTQPGLSCEECLARRISPKDWTGRHVCFACLIYTSETFTSYVQPPVPRLAVRPTPRGEPDEYGCVPCDGCGRVVCDEGDYGEYRPGWWCSRACAYA